MQIGFPTRWEDIAKHGFRDRARADKSSNLLITRGRIPDNRPGGARLRAGVAFGLAMVEPGWDRTRGF